MPGFIDAPTGGKYEDYNEGEVPQRGEYAAKLHHVGEIFERQESNPQYPGVKYSLWFTWELTGTVDARRKWQDSKGRPFRVSKRYNVVVAKDGGKSGVPIRDEQGNFKMLKPDTRDETRQTLGIDLRDWGVALPATGKLEDLVGLPCSLYITNSPRDKGGMFANVDKVLPAEVIPDAGNVSTATDGLPF